MNGYAIGLFIHVLAVIVLFIAAAFEATSLSLLARAKSVEQIRAWDGIDRTIEKLFPVSSIVLVGAGLYMLATRWGWSIPWANLSLLAVIVMAILGPTVNSRRIKAIHQAAEAAHSGPLTAELERLVSDPVLHRTVYGSGGLIVGIVYLMTTKPGAAGSIVALIVGLALGLIAGQILAVRRAGEAAAVAPAK